MFHYSHDKRKKNTFGSRITAESNPPPPQRNLQKPRNKQNGAAYEFAILSFPFSSKTIMLDYFKYFVRIKYDLSMLNNEDIQLFSEFYQH